MTTTDQPETDVHPPPEIVEPAAGEVAVVDHRNALIDQAADAALMPGVPGRDEFITLAMTARILSLSGAAPSAVKNNPYVAFHVALVGRDLGISPSAALQLIDVIGEGDRTQLSLSPQLLTAQIRRLGLGSIVPGVQEAGRSVAVALAPGGSLDGRCWPAGHVDGCGCKGIIGATEFTWADAQNAGLVMRGCKPGEHTVECLNYRTASRDRCHQGYRTYPKRMMWWRAAGWCANDWFPEAGLGLYSPEELGATVDEEGRPIDPASVELPEGYQPKPPPAVEQASDDDKAALAERIHALIDEAKAALREVWQAADDSGHPNLPPLAQLAARQMPKAKALVDMIEKRAAKGEWAAPESAPSAPPEPAYAPQPDPVTADAAPAPEAPEDADSDPERAALVEKVRKMRLGEVRECLVALDFDPQGWLPQAMRDQLVEAWLAWVPEDVDAETGEIADPAEESNQGEPT